MRVGLAQDRLEALELRMPKKERLLALLAGIAMGIAELLRPSSRR